MKYLWLDEYLLSKTGVCRDYKAEWGWDRYMIRDKMFAAVCYDDAHQAQLITLKLEPCEGELLRKQYADILPGYYMNKLHWNSVKADGEVPEDLLRSMLDRAYLLVLHGFSQKKQQEILNGKN